MSSTLVVLANLAAALFAGLGLSLATVKEPAATRALKEQILSSTIQIEAYDDIRSEGGVIHSTVEEGLGTLVEVDGRRFITTHNHWRIPPADLDWVELYDGYGRLLVMMDGAKFRSLRRFHDAGTLLFAVPPELSGIVPVPLNSSASLVSGDSLWITTRDKQNDRILHVSQATVKQAGGPDMPGQLRLHGTKTAVAPGDSGGGVWQNGRLVGNMWAIVESVETTPWSWLGGYKAARPTGDYIAARLPRVEDVWFAGDDQALPPAASGAAAANWIYDPVELP